MDAAYFMPHRVVYKVVDYAGLADCDVIVNAVGKIELLATLNRDSEMENSVREVASFVDKIMADLTAFLSILPIPAMSLPTWYRN